MMKRFNSLYLGKYGDIDVAGYKSQFTHSFYDDSSLKPLFMTERGPGFNPEVKEEGIMKDIVEKTSYVRPWVDEKLKEIGCEEI